MNLKSVATRVADHVPVPDAITRFAIEALVHRTRVLLPEDGEVATLEFARSMTGRPIAAHPEAANAQHYEVPAEFFELVLGPRRKYSCCLYESRDTTLAEAEELALEETVRRARLGQGQRILELGCGWGSLSLFMAEKSPQSTILAVSNSHSQRAFIESQAKARGLGNLRVVTADVNEFSPSETFDRVISVEMFEHLSNWPELLSRVRPWLNADGFLFLHVFSHARVPYRFNHEDPNDWIARHFFTGGIMPSHHLIGAFGELFEVVETWRWNGRHYEHTAEDWLANMDSNEARVMKLFAPVYGEDARIWWRRWRLFFLATAGLFGHRAGEEWGVSHHLLQPVR